MISIMFPDTDHKIPLDRRISDTLENNGRIALSLNCRMGGQKEINCRFVVMERFLNWMIIKIETF